jgi:hypothetical protein
VKIKAVSIDVFHGELSQAPRLLLQGFDNPRTPRAQFVKRRVDISGEYPVNGGFEWAVSFAEENGEAIAGDGADAASGIKPSDLEAERIAVMLLSPFDIFDWEFRRRMTELGSRFIHDSPLSCCGQNAIAAEIGLSPEAFRSEGVVG